MTRSQELTAEHLFASDRITDIKIEIPVTDWDAIRHQSRTLVEALTRELPESPFTYVSGDVTIDGVLIKNVGIRKKGFIGSLNENRPSLKIKFAEYVDQSPVRGLDRLTLNNNHQDPGRINQYLAFKLFRKSGTHAPRCGFAKVTVNGDYLGVYSNVEPIKPDFLKFSFGKSSGALFEGTVTDFIPKWSSKFEQKNDAADHDFVQAITDALATNDPGYQRLGELVDIDAFLKFWAMESLIGFWDGYCSNQNNFYVYRDPANSKFYFIPWGIDSAFTNEIPIPPYRITPKSVHARAILPNRLYRDQKIKKKYETTLMSLMEQHWNEDKLIAEIDQLQEMLGGHVLKSNVSFEESLTSFREFIKGRRKSILTEFENGPPKLLSVAQTPVYFIQTGSAEIQFSTQWFQEAPRNPAGVGDVSVDATVDDNKLELSELGVYAKQDDRESSNASIIIIGKRESNGRQIIIGTGLPKSNFLSTDSSTGIGGVLIQPGFLGMINAKTRMMIGSVTLEEASMQPGSPVKGKMTMAIGEFITGDVQPVESDDSQSPTPVDGK